MSLSIIKAGIFDSVQDGGRPGYQHLGINRGGPMDGYAAGMANALLGKPIDAPLLEMHFPAAAILFEMATIICITGADFSPQINGIPVPMYQPIVVTKGVQLHFTQWQWGAWCYLSFLPHLQLEVWLGSYSTNIKAKAGGYKGRTLLKDDRLECTGEIKCSHLVKEKEFAVLPWKASYLQKSNVIGILRGNEWDWIEGDALSFFEHNVFHVSGRIDRMGYQLIGKKINKKSDKELVSSPVNFGTIQLLPNGQLIVLMADHQTTGGYPRAAHVIAADLPLLAQLNPKDAVYFECVDLEMAEKKIIAQQKNLQQLQEMCFDKLQKLM
jgi:antagonist of KipI